MANIHEAFIYAGAVCSRCFPRAPSLKGSQQHREKQHYPVLTLQTGDKGPQGIRDVSKATPLLNGRDVLEVWGQPFHNDENNKQNCFLNDFLTTDKPMQHSPDAKHCYKCLTYIDYLKSHQPCKMPTSITPILHMEVERQSSAQPLSDSRP